MKYGIKIQDGEVGPYIASNRRHTFKSENELWKSDNDVKWQWNDVENDLENWQALNKIQCFSNVSKVAQYGFNRQTNIWNFGVLS